MDPGDHGKRKMAEKDMPRRGRGRTAAARNSRDAPHGRGGREARDQYIEEEERLERLGHITNAFLTPLCTSLSLMADTSKILRVKY
jgi:hypothetical protein